MKKSYLVLSLALLAGLLLAGCLRQRPEPTEQTEPETTAAPTEWVLEMNQEEKKYEGVTLRFGAMWQEDSPEAAVLTQAAEVFELETGACVEILWPGEGNGEVDILQLPGSELPAWVEQLLDLTELAAETGYDQKSYVSLTEQVVSRCGHLAAIPQTPYISGFYYNVEAFETSGVIRKPQNWAELRTVCDMLAAGSWLPLSLNSEVTDDLLLMHLIQYLGVEETAVIATEGGMKAEGAKTAAADIGELAVTGQVGLSGQNKVALSNGAMTYGTNALCRQVEEAALTDIRWGMFPYPGADGGEPMIVVDADVLAVDARCAEPRAAFDFIMLLATGEFDQLRADLTVGIPADPANSSPIAGAPEVLALTQVVELPAIEWTEDQLKAITKLWSGKYQESGSFSVAMEAAKP